MANTVSLDRKAYIITGPTSGIGRATAFELAKHGMVVLVGRDRAKLDEVQKAIEKNGQQAVSVVCDLSEPASVRSGVADIIALHLPIVGLLNNAGIAQTRATKNSLGSASKATSSRGLGLSHFAQRILILNRFLAELLRHDQRRRNAS